MPTICWHRVGHADNLIYNASTFYLSLNIFFSIDLLLFSNSYTQFLLYISVMHAHALLSPYTYGSWEDDSELGSHTFPLCTKSIFLLLLNFLTQKTNNWYFNTIHIIWDAFTTVTHIYVYTTHARIIQNESDFFTQLFFFCYDFGLSYFNLFYFFLSPYDIVFFVARHYSTFVMGMAAIAIIE